jgi:hypothetical protein
MSTYLVDENCAFLDGGDFRIILIHSPGRSAKLFRFSPGVPQKMDERKDRETGPKQPKKELDTYFQKRPVGRPHRMPGSEVWGRSQNLRLQFEQIWSIVGDRLLRAETDLDVLTALELAGQYWRDQLGPGTIPSLILSILRDSKFPKLRVKQQINFLADSLGAWGTLSPRRSRDICEQERRKGKQEHHIVRREFYVECSCGYQGAALNNACRWCGAKIPDTFDSPYFEAE